MTLPGAEAIQADLAEARARTWQLVDPLSDDQLRSPVTEYLSPPVWDMGHMANFEERWLVQFFLECPELHTGYNDIYNAFQHARKDRPKLRLLDREGVRKYMGEVRERTEQVLNILQTTSCDAKYLEDWFIHRMLVLHEDQHQETLLQTLQMLGPDNYTPSEVVPQPKPVGELGKGWIFVDGGPFSMGTELKGGVYDNEAPSHDVDVGAFRIARYPVTNGEYLAFVDDGGYEDRSNWSERGAEWLDSVTHRAPMHWQSTLDGRWERHALHGIAPINEVSDEILCHISYFEAEAYAKWVGARLPTEAEWEKAARWNPGQTTPARNPWGEEPATPERCNVNQLHWGPSRIGSRPDSASPMGVEHMIGDVWEWTSSEFDAYPGFQAFPYDEYSKVFFGGDYRVLRGGSWATRAGCANGTFRNWDHPYRRQIFAGVRLAMDA